MDVREADLDQQAGEFDTRAGRQDALWAGEADAPLAQRRAPSLGRRVLLAVLRRLSRYLHDTPRKSYGHIGTNVFFGGWVQSTCPERVSIGDNCHIGAYALLHSQGGLQIESGTILGPYVAIYTANHNYDPAEAIPYDATVNLRPVRIKSNVWIGGHVVITPGVTVGEGAVLAAGAVVTRDVPDCAVVGGNPARVLKYRDQERYARLKRDNRIYIRLREEHALRPREVGASRQEKAPPAPPAAGNDTRPPREVPQA